MLDKELIKIKCYFTVTCFDLLNSQYTYIYALYILMERKKVYEKINKLIKNQKKIIIN